MQLDKKLLLPLLTALVLHGSLLAWAIQKPVRFLPPGQDVRVALHVPEAVKMLQPATEANNETEETEVNEEEDASSSIQPASAVASSLLDRLAQATPHYFYASELDHSPQPLHAIVVPIPDLPLGKVEASVQLELWINQWGAVEKVEILHKEVPDLYLQAVRETFLQARFAAGIKTELPVASRMRIEVRYFEALSP